MTNLNTYFTDSLPARRSKSEVIDEKKLPSKNARKLATIKKIIFSKRPLLQKIYKDKGNFSLFGLTLSNNANKQTIINKERQAEFISTFSREVKTLLGEEVSQSVALQLKDNYYISTTEHHGPITHPGKLNSTLLSSQIYTHLNQQDLRNVIVLACANISFDNYSFPRGIEFNSAVNGEIKEQNLVFFSRAVRPRPVIYFESYDEEAIKTAHAKLNELVSTKEVSLGVSEKIHALLDEVYADPKVLEQKLFSDQVVITNFNIWKKIHEGQEKAPNLVYIEQEKIINSLILKHHINKETLINKILFSKKYHDLIIKHFDKIMSAFNLETKSGTFLFWGLPEGSKYRVQLWKKGNKLTTDDGSYQLTIDPKSIARAIKNREIYPSTLLSFIILSFYYGIKLLGSFNQTTYLTAMQEAFIDLLEEVKLTEEIEYVSAIPTNDLTYPRPILAYANSRGQNGSRVALTGLDMILYKNEQTFDVLFRNSLRVNVKEALDRVMPDLYVSYIPEQVQDKKLLDLTSEKVDEMLGIEHKIEPSVDL